MEVALGASRFFPFLVFFMVGVLILILVEVALGVKDSSVAITICAEVLILILVEVALGEQKIDPVDY